MNEVASGPEFAVLVLMVIAAHLLAEERLVLDQFLDPVGEETVITVPAVARLRITLAQLQLSLGTRLRCSFIIYHFHTH